MLEMFLDDNLVEVIGIVDVHTDAPGMILARERGVPAYVDINAALHACKEFPDCIVYNLTHDDSLGAIVRDALGRCGVTSGIEAKLIWQMVTNLKRVKQELEESQHQLQAIFDNAMDGIIISDEFGMVRSFNPAAENLFGYEQPEVLGKHISSLIPEARGKQPDSDIGCTTHTEERLILSIKAREFKAVRKGGAEFPIELSASEMRLDSELLFIGIVRDITERRRAELRIAQLAHYDFLTQLPNRALFKDRLERAIARAKRNRGRCAVLFLDLDGFKSINDVFGHEAGDELLCQVAARLKTAIRESDTVARMGGDEFTFIINDVGDREHVALLAGKIHELMAEPLVVAGAPRGIRASIGGAIFPDDAADYEGLLRFADEAMYLAKQAGKNTFCIHGNPS
jgi:diguanylate cyclase (GGDEF)-like protein/PAS domain S-box-containing protein